MLTRSRKPPTPAATARTRASGGRAKGVVCAAYTSPTLVLLAYDWPGGNARHDFLGFAIRRTPGFGGAASSWLPNRIGFDGPPPGGDLPSNAAPIQKFYWWDARITTKDRGTSFAYDVIPVTGSRDALTLNAQQAAHVDVRVPTIEEHGISSWFNRAIVSSQSFARQFPKLSTASQEKAARAWLANGLEQAVPTFLAHAGGKDVEGAIYHLTDDLWIIPALRNYGGHVSLVFNRTSKDHASDQAIDQLVAGGRPKSAFAGRSKANIMHDKFLVRVGEGDHPEAVLTGSANFTSEGLSAQANVLHALESPELASLYLARKRLLDGDPALRTTQADQQGWSDRIAVGDARMRVFFPPEGKMTRASLDAIVAAVKAARHSVLLCAFDPTDGDLLDAVFNAGDRGLLMLGLVNRIATKAPAGDPNRADVAAEIAIMNRAEKSHDITSFNAFRANDTPDGFAPERVLWPGESPKIMVRVHHKFVVIDAEGDNPVVFTGSANFSGNSLHSNDENLLEITGSPRLARIYFAEFLRLYEHYRARDASNRRQGTGGAAPDHTKFTLTGDSAWARKYFVAGSPEAKARQAMANASPLAARPGA
jgi:phosphatidylserine/phosphatidylglycerophosphate/cardiolipin synthase-like enzyme